MCNCALVVPHVGTWIEIHLSSFSPFAFLSFPTWERELKYLVHTAFSHPCSRSPRGNVNWNRVSIVTWKFIFGRSPRGNVNWNTFVNAGTKRIIVVPHVGTWIEIINSGSESISYAVVPHVGTWIEIATTCPDANSTRSFPTWERGLKYTMNWRVMYPVTVVPHAGTWIEMVVRRFEGCCTCRYPHGNADWNNKEEIKRCGTWGVPYAGTKTTKTGNYN